MSILIADSGATKCEWCLVSPGKRTKTIFTQGISPYFMNAVQIESLVRQEVLTKFKNTAITEVYYYGTGLAAPENAKLVTKALKKVFSNAAVQATHDVMGAAKAVCGDQKGLATILGTGSSVCFYDGKKIKKTSPGLGYVLGDEGSGAYLGKKVVQYFLYNTFDEELMYKFNLKYGLNRSQILDQVYKQPLPNRYLAGFALFLSENRGHYMVENIVEDGINDFFFTHLCKIGESWKYPISFVGGVAYGFQDVVRELCETYEFELGTILKNPMEGLIKYHK